MVNSIAEIIEDHVLIAIFLVCLTVIISFIEVVNIDYISVPYHSEIALYQLLILVTFILSFLVLFVIRHYRD
ncbi:MAG: hypothetical protein QW597_07515 [Thermoplasmataceae archaeon]